MKIEFDPLKNKCNLRQHGIALSFAEQLEWDAMISWPDRRYAYDEVRMNALVPCGVKCFAVTFVERCEKVRILSIRSASRKEREYYARNYHY